MVLPRGSRRLARLRRTARSARFFCRSVKPETMLIHGDVDHASLDEGGGEGIFEQSVTPPISMTTTYLASLHDQGYVYARDTQPIRTRCEKLISELEGGTAVLYASGLAATFATLFHLQPSRVGVRGGYHGTHNVLSLMRDKQQVVIQDIDDEVGEGDVIWLESPRNPMCEVYDVKHYASRAHAVGAKVVVDATMAPPPLQKLIPLGADVVVHSATKYYAGHSDVLAGVAVAADSSVGAGLLSERSALGSPPGGLETWLLLRSMRTMDMRVKRQSESATKVVAWLDSESGGRKFGVEVVHHPSIPSRDDHKVAIEQMPGGCGGVFSIELDTEDAAKKFPGKLELFRDATSLGGVESLAEWRRKYDSGVPAGLVRMSIGLEDPDDIIRDIEQALKAVRST